MCVWMPWLPKVLPSAPSVSGGPLYCPHFQISWWALTQQQFITHMKATPPCSTSTLHLILGTASILESHYYSCCRTLLTGRQSSLASGEAKYMRLTYEKPCRCMLTLPDRWQLLLSPLPSTTPNHSS